MARHSRETGNCAASASTNRNLVTVDRSPWQRKPRPASGSRAPGAAPCFRAPARAAAAAPPSSAHHHARLDQPGPAATSYAASAPSSPARPPAASASAPRLSASAPPRAGTPAGTAVSSSASHTLLSRAAWPESITVATEAGQFQSPGMALALFEQSLTSAGADHECRDLREVRRFLLAAMRRLEIPATLVGW